MIINDLFIRVHRLWTPSVHFSSGRTSTCHTYSYLTILYFMLFRFHVTYLVVISFNALAPSFVLDRAPITRHGVFHLVPIYIYLTRVLFTCSVLYVPLLQEPTYHLYQFIHLFGLLLSISRLLSVVSPQKWSNGQGRFNSSGKNIFFNFVLCQNHFFRSKFLDQNEYTSQKNQMEKSLHP